MLAARRVSDRAAQSTSAGGLDRSLTLVTDQLTVDDNKSSDGYIALHVKGAVFLTQVHPVPAQADLSSWPVGELLR